MLWKVRRSAERFHAMKAETTGVVAPYWNCMFLLQQKWTYRNKLNQNTGKTTRQRTHVRPSDCDDGHRLRVRHSGWSHEQQIVLQQLYGIAWRRRLHVRPLLTWLHGRRCGAVSGAYWVKYLINISPFRCRYRGKEQV